MQTTPSSPSCRRIGTLAHEYANDVTVGDLVTAQDALRHRHGRYGRRAIRAVSSGRSAPWHLDG